MSPPPSPPRRRTAILAAVVATTLAAGAWLATGTASAGTLSGSLYRDPNSQRHAMGRRQPRRLACRRHPGPRSPASRRRGGWRISTRPPSSPRCRLTSARPTRQSGTCIRRVRDPQPRLWRSQRRWCARSEPVPDAGSRRSPRDSAPGWSSSSSRPTRWRSPPAWTRTPWPPVTKPSAPRCRPSSHATQTPRCTSTADTPPGTAPPTRPTAFGRPESSSLTASTPTCRTSTRPPTRPTTAGRSSRPCLRPASPASARSSTPAVTEAPRATGARTTTPTGGSDSGRR